MFKISIQQDNYKFKKENIEKIASVLTQTHCPSHKTISKKSGLSLTTVGYAVKALKQTGIIYEEHKALRNEQKVCGHILFQENICQIIIDVSTPQYSMWAIDGSMSILSVYKYTYNSDFSTKDNLRIFFERGKSDLETKVDCYCGIALVVSDNTMFMKENTDSYLQIETDPFVAECLKSVFSQYADCIVSFGKSAEYNLGETVRKYDELRIYYVYISNDTLSCFIDQGQNIFTCFPPSPIEYGIKLVPEDLSHNRLLEMKLTSLIESVNTVIRPEIIIIDSDRFVLGTGLERAIQRNILKIFGNAPKISIYRKKPPLYIKGASALLRKKVIENILSSPDNMPNEFISEQ